MNSTAVFEKVAAGQITAGQAADELIEADRKAVDDRRPLWAPPLLWSICTASAGIGLALLGFKKD